MDNSGVQIMHVLAILLILTTVFAVVVGAVLFGTAGIRRRQAASLAYARVYATGRFFPTEGMARDLYELSASVANRAPPTFQSRIGKQARFNQRV